MGNEGVMSNVAFSQWQPVYAEHGIATIPCSQAKRPLVKHPQKFGCRGSTEIASKFPDAQTFGFYNGRYTGLTTLESMIRMNGYSPMRSTDMARRRSISAAAPASSTRSIGTTASAAKSEPGKVFRSTCCGAGLTIAPPGVVAKGQYEIIQGSLDDLDRLPANARQIFYVARPLIEERTDKPLRYDYFSQKMLPDYINKLPECVGWDVVYDDRGHFVEPHTERMIGLGHFERSQLR